MPNSFAPGTPVLMADGSQKPIDQLQVGDQVMAEDPSSGAERAEPVVAVIVGKGEKHLVSMVIDGHAVTATDNHPFWSADRQGWVTAGSLRVGEHVQLADGRVVEVDSKRSWTEQTTVYNLTVDHEHTYFAGIDSVLVHNGCKTFANADGTQTMSGWGSAPEGVARATPGDVMKVQAEIGHPVKPAGAFDQGVPGQYYASHAERQAAVLKPGSPIEVSSEMCVDCQNFFSRLASSRGEPQVVRDPARVRVFNPNGTVTGP